MKRKLICSFYILVCGCLFSGCQGKKEPEKTPSPIKAAQAKSTESVSPSAARSEGAEVKGATVATVNGTAITQGDVDQAVEAMMMRFGGRLPPEQVQQLRPHVRKQAIENLITQELLLQEVEKKGIHPSKKAVEEKIAEIEANFPSPEIFQEQLARAGVSGEKLRQNIERNLAIESLIQSQIPEDKKVTAEEIEAYYRNNPKSFEKPERVKASHILIKVSPEDSPEEKAKKRAEISKLKDEIAKGADFAKLAEAHSECPSKDRGGDLGFFERGSMVKPFEEAAFGMKVGEVSDIVETKYGYHLIKVTDRQEAEVIPLEKSREDIASMLNQQKGQESISDYLKKLRGAAAIEYQEASQP
jgi:peptidyl-prolyl cis-trans isomerase C